MIVLALAALGAVLLVAAGPAQAMPSAVEAEPSANLVVIGVAGLRWSDVKASPELTALLNESDVGSITVKTAGPHTCPIDGWLTINAGTRAWGSVPDLACGDLPAVTGGRLQGWQTYVDRQAEHHTGAPLGRIGSSGAGICGFGPGGAVAVAATDGTVANWSPTFDAASLARCPGAIVDAGTLPLREGRAEARQQLATLVAEARAQQRRVLLVGVAEEAAGVGRQSMVALRLPPDDGPRWLTSGSTRRPGLIQLTDVTATVLPSGGSSGTPVDGDEITSAGDRHTDAAEVIADRLDTNERFEAPRSVLVPVILTLVAAQLAALAWFLVTRSRRARRTAVFFILSQCGFFIATFLSTVAGWWRWPSPDLSLYLVALAISVGFAAAATLVLKRQAYLGIAVAAYLLLLLDGVLGTPMQVGSMFADGPVIGGRFYGFGNSTFATLAVAALVTSGLAAHRLLHRSRTAAAGAVLVIGGLAIIVDGVPGWGTDFGGIIALTPAVLLLAWITWRGRISWRALIGIGLTGFLAVALFAFADYLRPASERSHFGTFVARLLDGDAGDVLVRKLQVSAAFFDSPAGWAMLVAVLLTSAACVFPEKVPSATYRRYLAEVPMARPTLLSMVLCGWVGMLLNDVGVVLPAIMAGFAVSLLVSRLVDDEERATPETRTLPVEVK